LTGSATGTDSGEHSDAFHDADFPFGTVAQSGQRGLVAGAMMSGDSCSTLSNSISITTVRCFRPRS
jgi:hypothetical protein